MGEKIVDIDDSDGDVEDEVIDCEDCPDVGKIKGYIFAVECQRFKVSLTAPCLDDLVEMILMAEDLVNGNGKGKEAAKLEV